MMPGKRKLQQDRTAGLFRKCIRSALKVNEKITISQWAEAYRVLDESSNFKGRWTNDLTPYLVGVMDAFNDPYIQEINFVKSTQVGGTEAIINMIGYIIDQSPARTMIVYPTDDLAKEVSKDRIMPSLLKTKAIRDSYEERESKELNRKFHGMNLYITGAGSPSKLASRSIKYLFFDEIDKLEGAGKKEASPYNLAKERTRTYTYSRKIVTTSTPTIRENYVWSIHEAAEEQRNYYVKCPHCGEWFVFSFDDIKYAGKEEGMTLQERAKTAKYVCRECGCFITDQDKPAMLRGGEWRAVKKGNTGHPKTVSYWINALYSRFVTWEEIALEFLKSKDDPEKLQNFKNSWLAEPWEDMRIKTEPEMVLERQAGEEQFVVPEWARLITGGVDVQETSLYWTVRAFGDGITSQNIAHGQALSWREVDEVMNFEYRKETGETLLVRLALIDSGDQTDKVYDFCASRFDWAVPCKGSSNRMYTHYRISRVNKAGSRAQGMQLVIIDTGKYKDMIAERMQRPNGTGSWMVYKGCDLEYAKQVTSEHRVRIKKGGRTEERWAPKRSHADNHYLDAEVYAMAAADICGVRRMHMEEAQETVETEHGEENTPEESWIGENESWI